MNILAILSIIVIGWLWNFAPWNCKACGSVVGVHKVNRESRFNPRGQNGQNQRFSNGLYLLSPKARQEYMEVALEPTSRARNIIGDNPIDLIKLIILIPFKPNFEKGSRWYMFVRKEFTPRFNFKPLAQEGGIQGTGGLVFSCMLHTYAESCKTCKKSMQKCAIACRSVQ